MSSYKGDSFTEVTTRVGNILANAFHYLMLFAIGSLIVWSAGVEFFHLVVEGRASIEDILLLFIYLELGAMVGIYFKTKRLPVRFLIYIAITALTRMMVGVIQEDHEMIKKIPLDQLAVEPLLYISGAILVLCLAALTIRFGSFRYPSDSLTDKSS